MLKSAHRDLVVIILLCIASLVFLKVPALYQSHLNLILQLLILLFLPGYALVAAIDPLFNRRPLIKRMFFSFIVSLFLTIISIFIPVEVPSYVVLIVLTVIMSIFALFRRKISSGILLLSPGEVKQEVIEQAAEDEGDKLSPTVIKDELEEFKKQDKTTTKRRFFLDIFLIIILTGLCALFILEPTLNKTIVRTVLGLLLVLFLPGYTFIAFMFPKRGDLGIIERLVLSFGLSITITTLIGLALNYTPSGVHMDSILVSLTGVTVLLCAVSFLRRWRIPEENRFLVDFGRFFKGLKKGFSSESQRGKILSVILIASIILAISTIAYILVMPNEGESFTEFYILGPDGKASDYPTNLTTDQEGRMIIGIVNHENTRTSYRLVVTSNNTVQLEQALTLEDGQKIEIPFNFTAGNPGERKMEFFLYKLPDNNNIYLSLRLWLNISESSNESTI